MQKSCRISYQFRHDISKEIRTTQRTILILEVIAIIRKVEIYMSIIADKYQLLLETSPKMTFAITSLVLFISHHPHQACFGAGCFKPSRYLKMSSASLPPAFAWASKGMPWGPFASISLGCEAISDFTTSV